jgi:hypothetical protein
VVNRSTSVPLAIVAALAAVPAALGSSASADDRPVDSLAADASPPEEERRETASGGGASDDASAAPSTEDAGPPIVDTWRPPHRLPPVGLEVGLDALLYQGLTPTSSVALGPSVLLLVPPGRQWGLRAAAGLGLGSAYGYEKDINLRTAFTHVRLAACATLADKHFRGLFCLGGLYGVLDTKGETFAGKRTGSTVTAGPFGQLQLGVGGGGIFFHVGVDVVVPTARASYGLSFPEGTSGNFHPFKTPAVVAIGELGISFRLW